MQLSSDQSYPGRTEGKYMTMPNKGVTGPLNLTVSHLQRTFHPTLRITVHPWPSNPVRSDCYALLHFTFPDEVFVDKDELIDRWGKNTVPKPFGESKTSAGSGAGKKEKNGFGVVEWTIRPDVVDIERPVISTLSDTEEESREEGLKVVDGRTRLSVAMEIPDIQAELDIPLHGRYLRPDESGEREVVVFGEGGGEMRGMWMCNMHPDQIFASPPPRPKPSAEDTHNKGSHCVTLEVDTHPHPFPKHNQTITITLPTGHPSHQVPVEVITALAIWVGWGYLVWKIWRLVGKQSRERVKGYKVE